MTIWTSRRFASGLIAALLMVWLSSHAEAQEQAPAMSFKERYERAVAIFKSGQYDKAIEEFQAVYQMRPLPLLLFNLAQAHRKAGHFKEALDLYERFLREDPKTEIRPETEGYISDVKLALEQQRIAEQKAAEQKAQQEKLALEKLLLEEPPPMGYDRFGNQLRPPLRWKLISGIILMSFGVLVAGAGGALFAVDGRQVCTLRGEEELCPDQLDTRNLGIGLLAGGAAAIAGGAVLIGLDFRKGKEGSQRALLHLSGRF